MDSLGFIHERICESFGTRLEIVVDMAWVLVESFGGMIGKLGNADSFQIFLDRDSISRRSKKFIQFRLSIGILFDFEFNVVISTPL